MTEKKPIAEVQSDALKAKLSWIEERDDGMRSFDPIYRFEIKLDRFPAPLVAEAVVTDFTFQAVRKIAEEAGVDTRNVNEWFAYLDRYVNEKGEWYYCKRLRLPWSELTEAEIVQACDAFVRLYFDLRCRWREPSQPMPNFPPKVGPYQLINLKFTPHSLPHAYRGVISTRDILS